MREIEIPESWAMTTLGEIGQTMIGLTYSPSDISPDGIPVLRSGNIQKGRIDLNDLVRVKKEIRSNLIVNQGDILICARNGSKALVGKSAKIDSLPEPMTFGAFMAIYRSRFNDYILHFLFSPFFRKHLSGVGTATINQITQSNLKETTIPLPPLAEQKRIVAKIESTSQKIEVIERSVEQAEQLLTKYRESLLAKAFRGELVPQNPNDEPASKLLERIRSERASAADGKKKKKDELPPIKEEEIPFEIPKSWAWVRLGNIINLKHGYAFKSESFKKTGKFILTTPGHFFEKGGFRSQGNKTKFCESNPKEDFQLDAGDMIVAMTEQSPGLLGSAALIPDDGNKYLHNQRLGKITPIDPKIVTLEFLYLYFNHSILRNALAKSCSGSTVRHTSPDRIFSVAIPLPPLNEQTKIVQSVSRQTKGLDLVLCPLRSLKGLQKSISSSTLKSAFSGRLVAQIESEGTGHDLLQEIQKKESNQIPSGKKVSSRGRKK